ncbi:Pyridine nucleotide-disulphide oxidoreductase [Belliella buryatensis]|uniref:Pyridine nucleotide-disulphide oxidoreductase n=1 Tax=Belliella buryatensis TaxID=1500549 RepID=A0A239AN50_9BACT|nr:FAD-dependent oxidoreductase [Belliella buryatensis]SNR97106.1 Pyridine nucleotide-disulphide oxidoreductase [Belliella buryatensis]
MTGHSTKSKSKHFVIIGNGIAGVTCARHLRKADQTCQITIISGESKHFFSRTALMYIYMGHMKYEHTKPYEDWFWEKNRIALKQAWVSQVDTDKKTLIFSDDSTFDYDVLIIASGSKPNKFGWKGENLQGVQGLYSIQDLELMEKNSQAVKRAVVVGGGLIGIEMAEMFSSRKIPVTFLVREKNFWDTILPEDEAKLINRHIKEHHIDLRLETELDEILDDGTGRVKAIKTKSGDLIDCQFVGLTVGVRPNVDFLKESKIQINRGVVIDACFKTNMEDVYAIGDCAEFQEAPAADRKNIEQVWYTGRMHGETLAYNLSNSKKVPYQPGIWFNSAKFFDIEYQTYGFVPPIWGEEIESFYWEDSKGKIAIRILYQKSNQAIIGVNAFGWRLRHEYFDSAIEKGYHLEKVLGELGQASFNPEFYKSLHKEVLKQYNQENKRSIQIKKQSFLQKLIGSRA